jgi:hypothetical protein
MGGQGDGQARKRAGKKTGRQDNGQARKRAVRVEAEHDANRMLGGGARNVCGID